MAEHEQEKTEWNSDIPHELAELIAGEYGIENLQNLADVALEAALDEQPDAYGRHSPFVRSVAKSALRMALGLKPLPEQEQGEI
ncbi:MAG: hypothetical protein ABIR37_01720 [Candidatus Saccharimonadales bacterium]